MLLPLAWQDFGSQGYQITSTGRIPQLGYLRSHLCEVLFQVRNTRSSIFR
jgi:hypothetical protein